MTDTPMTEQRDKLWEDRHPLLVWALFWVISPYFAVIRWLLRDNGRNDA